MRTTLSLEEALKKIGAMKNLYVGSPIRSRDTLGINFQRSKDGEDFDEETVAEVLPGCGRKIMEAQAALLAHAFNLFPELVEGLQSALDAEEKAYQWHGHVCLMDGVREKIRTIIAKAQTLTLPD